jgi:2-isopropylmalate synthase
MYDWSRGEPLLDGPEPASVTVVDETLRDGLQSASGAQPTASRKIDLVHAMAGIGVDVVSVGLPAAGPRSAEHSYLLCREIVQSKLPLKPTAAARTVVSDVRAIARAADRAGAPIEVYAFIGSSPIRHFVEGWDLDFLLRAVTASAREALAAGLPFCLVTEDTTRSHPDMLRALYRAAVDAGAGRVCLCDTTGHATPYGVEALVRFARGELAAMNSRHVRLDWHGHNDRGLALTNALWAAAMGVDRVHGTGLGVGERVGNTPLELLVDNLAQMGARPCVPDAMLIEYCDTASRALSFPIPAGHPIAGVHCRGARGVIRPYRGLGQRAPLGDPEPQALTMGLGQRAPLGDPESRPLLNVDRTLAAPS